MPSDRFLFLLPYGAALLLATAVGFTVWRRVHVPGASAFALSVLGQAIWIAGHICELLTPTLQEKIFWDDFQYIGTLLWMHSLLVFAWQYVGWMRRPTMRFLALLGLFPTVFMLLVATNGIHGLVRHGAALIPGAPFDALIYPFTPAVWALAVYGYALLFTAMFVVALAFSKAQALFRAQAIVILIGILVPVSGMTLTLLGVSFSIHRDTSPFTFAASDLIIGYGLLHYGLFDLVPLAREKVVEVVSMAVVVADRHGRVVDLNPAAAALLGSAPAASVGAELGKMLPEWHALRARWKGEECVRTPVSPARAPAGRHFEAELVGLAGAKEHPEGFLIQILDVTDRHRAERAGQESEERYRRLAEATTEGIAIQQGDRIEDVNSALCEISGYTHEELVGSDGYTLIAPEDRDALRRHFAADASEPVEVAGLRKDGSRIHLEMRGQTIDLGGRRLRVVAVQDITRRRELEDQICHAQRMETVGRLAGGIAHDFNNLLSVIGGFAELARIKSSRGQPFTDYLEQIDESVRLGTALTAQLLAFARKQVLAPKPVDLDELVHSSARMLKRLLGEDIELTIEASSACVVNADPWQIEQVLLNLAVNARDAMPRGGRLLIRTMTAEKPPAAIPEGLRAGPYVVLIVQDTGEGIATEALPRLFEPFFTTKERGKGTGLGLSTCYGIVTKHGGHIEAQGTLGEGATFRVWLPLLPLKEAALNQAVEMNTPVTGAERILVAEDDLSLRELTRDFLSHYGYTVLTASDGAEALELASDPKIPIDLILTDVRMPKLGGPQVIEALQAKRPGLRVLYTSGYTDDLLPAEKILEGEVNFIRKPYSQRELAARVRQVLDQPE